MRREVFLGEMEPVVPWKALLKVIEPHYPVAGCPRSQAWDMASENGLLCVATPDGRRMAQFSVADWAAVTAGPNP
jgi:hypothetical protein